MAVFQGLAALTDRQSEYDKKQAERNRPKANWFSIPKDNSVLQIQFLQELDESAENYNPKYGVYLGAVEHQAPGPKGYMSRALDTTEPTEDNPEGKDFAVEMLAKTGEKDWRARENFYINVAVQRPDGVKAEILSRNLNSTFVKALARKFTKSKGKGITGVTFDIFKQGTGAQTQWILEESDTEIDITGVEPWDLNEYAVRAVPYAEQEAFYMRNYEPEAKSDDEGSPFDSAQPQGASEGNKGSESGDKGAWGW